jgi:hypothetical protein
LGHRLPSRPSRKPPRPSSASPASASPASARPRHVLAAVGTARHVAGMRRSPATPGRLWPPRACALPFQAAGAPLPSLPSPFPFSRAAVLCPAPSAARAALTTATSAGKICHQWSTIALHRMHVSPPQSPTRRARPNFTIRAR